ncbi:MAG: glycosyltransferase family 2 protein [Rhodobacter sp.]|nr:glycosyltransferase family 2 protein [Rhodobacter sp.]
MLIVTLSSIPPRFSGIGETLQSLLAQSRRADRILLYIPERYRRFPDWDGALPAVPEGVEIRRAAQDLGPATKILAAAQEFRGQDCDLVYCDDDRAYGRDWLRDFTRTRARHPGCAIANLGFQAAEVVPVTGEGRLPGAARRTWRITDLDFQARFLGREIIAKLRRQPVQPPWRRVYKRSGYIDIAEGCGGVMVRPEFFSEAFHDIPPVLWSVDDVWLSGMLWAGKVPIWLRGNQFPPRETPAHLQAALAGSVLDGADRDAANRRCVEYFQAHHGIWL